MNWKSVPGYEGIYSVSDCGQVRSELRYVAHLNGPKRVNERVLRQNTDKDGYKTVVLQRNGTAKTFKVHRLVMLAFCGPSNLTVNHIDFDKTNNTISNLEYLTSLENMTHRRKYGGPIEVPKGSEHWNSRLSFSDWREILDMRKNGVPRETIARRFGIHPMTIYKAKNK